MQIILSPQYRDAPAQMSLARSGDVLTINGIETNLNDPGTCPWLAEPPMQQDHGWRVVLIFPIGPRAPQEALFPQPITPTGDGPVALPPGDLPEEEEPLPEPSDA